MTFRRSLLTISKASLSSIFWPLSQGLLTGRTWILTDTSCSVWFISWDSLSLSCSSWSSCSRTTVRRDKMTFHHSLGWFWSWYTQIISVLVSGFTWESRLTVIQLTHLSVTVRAHGLSKENQEILLMRSLCIHNTSLPFTGSLRSLLLWDMVIILEEHQMSTCSLLSSNL